MKLAIGICEKVNGICSTIGCFGAYNNKDKHFEEYKDVKTELISFFTCEICSNNSTENIENIAIRFVENEVDRVHLGVCAVKCKANRLEEIKEIFQSKGLEVIEGTH